MREVALSGVDGRASESAVGSGHCSGPVVDGLRLFRNSNVTVCAAVLPLGLTETADFLQLKRLRICFIKATAYPFGPGGFHFGGHKGSSYAAA